MSKLPVRNIAEVALGMRVWYPGVPDSRHGQFMSGTGKTSVTSAALGQRTTHDHRARLLLLAGVGSVAGRCLLFWGAESEKSAKGTEMTVYALKSATPIQV